MMHPHVFISFADELDKMAASCSMSGHMKSRAGRSPIRVAKLLEKDSAFGSVDTALQRKKPFKTKMLETFATARPYAVGGVQAALPAALLGKIFAGEGPAGTRAGKIMGVIGGALGITNVALKRWAKNHKRNQVAQQLTETT